MLLLLRLRLRLLRAFDPCCCVPRFDLLLSPLRCAFVFGVAFAVASAPALLRLLVAPAFDCVCDVDRCVFDACF